MGLKILTEEEKMSIMDNYLEKLPTATHSSDSSSSSSYPPPVKTEMTTDVGRQLVATRDIIAGEVIFTEEPFVPVSPRPDAQPVCFSCLRVLSKEGYSCCKFCGVPLCSENCEANRHSKEECLLLSRMGWQSSEESPIKLQELNLLMTPLRTLVYLNKDPELAKIVWAMVDGAESREKLNQPALEKQKKMARILKSVLNWELEDLEEKVLKVMGTFDVTGFDAPFPSGADGQKGWGRSLFPATAMMNHSCVPNAHMTFAELNKSMLIRATQNIPKGAPVCINYTKTKLLWTNHRRREYFQRKWFFTCSCPRCSDPTELGSYISSVKCKHCPGLVVPSFEHSDPWVCNTCNKTISNKTVEAALSLLGNSFAKVSNNEVKPLRRATIVIDKVLGPQYFLSITFKQQIVKVIMEKLITDCSISELWCVIDMTKLLLDVATKLAPGMSYYRGDMLYKHIRAALEILIRARKDKKEALIITNNKINMSGHTEENEELGIVDIDDRIVHSEVRITSNNSSPKDRKSKIIENLLKNRWKELDIKVLLEWAKEAQEILKYSTYYARKNVLDTNHVVELLQELLP